MDAFLFIICLDQAQVFCVSGVSATPTNVSNSPSRETPACLWGQASAREKASIGGMGCALIAASPALSPWRPARQEEWVVSGQGWPDSSVLENCRHFAFSITSGVESSKEPGLGMARCWCQQSYLDTGWKRTDTYQEVPETSLRQPLGFSPSLGLHSCVSGAGWEVQCRAGCSPPSQGLSLRPKFVDRSGEA